VWGHGYVARYFEGLPDAVWVKRWRCPDCRAVHTMRPGSHWRGFWASAAAIVGVLRGKLSGHKWGIAFSRQRQQYWWRGYQKQSRFSGTVVPLQALVADGVILATHSLTHRAIRPFAMPAYRIFAVTAAYSGP
jgi:hypothetical protein